ncbi:class 1 fructose-bisphosphatase [Helicobacter ailurogastricus]|uniref:Fructose-1,6-bisphosphatase class 1 n=1 Tax=Helicobacter ailurogastricus TaxID=1578720 RepID=A0A0K2XCB3_9HELI|nr:class 1 fructose-bisphosphatase [Helicobacter ailurogastricus]CRF41519.1 Fructose-1,6-bisphosphatase, type I [Helicobacter ailurogastricus]CRF42987.1 Fructose-1,6-bisphosphatase, type I [Helicobacter ailurogastricus]CRF43716.1 Fructose-1,6-bisphosphatase, type I [Helicobacter ailurogastricus]CRF52859.1 Fructose-1,6-bisphosphatase, type I [Helicobacter ailurogastricus]BDQ28327.1 fructose-1,6-bisphosphatase class 1 [Helicobacter ailurogastricus]
MLTPILQALQSLAPKIYQAIKQGDTRYTDHKNPTADLQLAVDVAVDRLIFEALIQTPGVGGVMSEEREQAHYNESGDLLIAFDPLDGSSVVGANFLVGSIFGVYARPALGFSEPQMASHLKMGAYILYGAKLELVVASDQGVMHYVFNEDSQEWHSQKDLKLKDKGKNIAPGGSWQYFSPAYVEFLTAFFKQGYRLRYSGSMVADVHHLLSKEGGLFCYPATQDAPLGKLRKLFEVYPLAFVVEKAGGLSFDGAQETLNTPLNGLHDKSPCFLGSKVEMEVLKQWMHTNKS